MAVPCLSLSYLLAMYHLFIIHAMRFLNNVDNDGERLDEWIGSRNSVETEQMRLPGSLHR